MVDTLTKVPGSMFAGDRLAFEKDFDDYPATTFTVTYYFLAGGKKQLIEGTADGSTHVFEAIATDTATWVPGRYAFHARATDGAGDIATIDSGWLVVLPDPSVESSDMRSHARKVVDACEAIIERRANNNQIDLINYSLGVVNASRDIAMVISLRDRYLPIVDREDNPTADRRHIKLRFGNP